MPLKFKIVFYNLMLFLIIFDVIYLVVWILSIEMNPVKAVLVAGITALLMPWAKATNLQTGKKVAIRSYALVLYKKYRNKY
ncbi:MAG: hypothetical protein Q8P34_20420 [Bacteroidota bacterium]|nr:hypothetical protein [Bacteroidota bacterium]